MSWCRGEKQGFFFALLKAVVLFVNKVFSLHSLTVFAYARVHNNKRARLLLVFTRIWVAIYPINLFIHLTINVFYGKIKKRRGGQFYEKGIVFRASIDGGGVFFGL